MRESSLRRPNKPDISALLYVSQCAHSSVVLLSLLKQSIFFLLWHHFQRQHNLHRQMRGGGGKRDAPKQTAALDIMCLVCVGRRKDACIRAIKTMENNRITSGFAFSLLFFFFFFWALISTE